MKSAFTLIELLVVITIIVVLLALLTPALDKAIYQAELAVCGANMNAVARGALVYAANFKRQYPYRRNLHGSGWETFKVYNGSIATDRQFDDRRVFDGYIAMKMFK